jgi:hypothetical protein
MALQRLAQATMLALVMATIGCADTEGNEWDAVNPPDSTDAGIVDPVDFTVEVSDACTPGTHCRRTLNVTDGIWVWSDTEGSVDITDELSATLKDEVYADLRHALQFGVETKTWSSC